MYCSFVCTVCALLFFCCPALPLPFLFFPNPPAASLNESTCMCTFVSPFRGSLVCLSLILFGSTTDTVSFFAPSSCFGRSFSSASLWVILAPRRAIISSYHHRCGVVRWKCGTQDCENTSVLYTRTTPSLRSNLNYGFSVHCVVQGHRKAVTGRSSVERWNNVRSHAPLQEYTASVLLKRASVHLFPVGAYKNQLLQAGNVHNSALR